MPPWPAAVPRSRQPIGSWWDSRIRQRHGWQPKQAESEAAEAAAVYERMSDQERGRGIVYDPVEE